MIQPTPKQVFEKLVKSVNINFYIGKGQARILRDHCMEEPAVKAPVTAAAPERKIARKPTSKD